MAPGPEPLCLAQGAREQSQAIVVINKIDAETRGRTGLDLVSIFSSSSSGPMSSSISNHLCRAEECFACRELHETAEE